MYFHPHTLSLLNYNLFSKIGSILCPGKMARKEFRIYVYLCVKIIIKDTILSAVLHRFCCDFFVVYVGTIILIQVRFKISQSQ